MKKIIYTLITLALLTSCKSIDKMVESGNYDQALRFGVDKLRGEKNKKTKFVRGVEKAYAKLNQQDLTKIKHLELNARWNSFDQIVDIYRNMKKRQQYIMPLLPLISKDGYVAEFKIVDYTELIHDASNKASEHNYNLGIQHLENAKQYGDKSDARAAFEFFDQSQYYFDDYKNATNLMREAYELGQSRILIESYVGGSNFAFDHTLDIIRNVDVSRLNTRWEKYYTQENENISFSYVATIEVSDILPGVERERLNTFTETKSIVDGQKPAKDKSGNLMKDTLGNVIMIDNYIDVTAQIEELNREKIAEMSGRIVVIDAQDNSLIQSIPIHVTHEFKDYACKFSGDKRALTDVTFKRIKHNISPFPSDYEITTEMAYAYKEAAEEYLSKISF